MRQGLEVEEDSDEEPDLGRSSSPSHAAPDASVGAGKGKGRKGKVAKDPIVLRQPTVLEQKIMAAARERQRAGITQKQVCVCTCVSR
jgi:hypothetical protein